MDLKAKRNRVVELVKDVNDIQFLNELLELLESHKDLVFWHKLPESHQASIKRAEKEIGEGNFLSHDEAMNGIQRRS